MMQKNALNQEKDMQKKNHKIIIELEKLTIYQKYSMESHKGQAVSSQFGRGTQGPWNTQNDHFAQNDVKIVSA